MQTCGFRRLGALCAGVVCCVLIGGCKTDTSPSPGLGDPYPAPLNDPQITVLAPELQQWLRFSPAVVVKDDRQPMAVEVPVRNTTANQYLIEYRFLFFDENGLQLQPTMGWKFQSLDPKQMARLSGKALSEKAESYRLEVRWSR